MTPGSKIVGIGSHHGDDQVGWLIVERLKGRGNVPADLVCLRDASSLLDHLDQCARLIIVDGCSMAGAPGSVRRLTWPDPTIKGWHGHSTHGLGVAEVLELAEELGTLPAAVVLFGVAVDGCQPGRTAGDALRGAVDQVAECVLKELADGVAK